MVVKVLLVDSETYIIELMEYKFSKMKCIYFCGMDKNRKCAYFYGTDGVLITPSLLEAGCFSLHPNIKPILIYIFLDSTMFIQTSVGD